MSTLKTFNLQHPDSAVINTTLHSDGSVTFPLVNAPVIQNGNSNVSITANGAVSISSNGLTRLTIDAEGRMTIPYQPSFHAHGLNTLASNATAVFPSIDFNVGNHYNASTGTFTVPVTGTYILGWTNIGGTTNDIYRWRFRVNGSNVSDIHLRQDTGATGTEYATNGMFTIPWRLNANDAVTIFYQADANTAPYGSGLTTNDYPRFWGYLLG